MEVAKNSLLRAVTDLVWVLTVFGDFRVTTRKLAGHGWGVGYEYCEFLSSPC